MTSFPLFVPVCGEDVPDTSSGSGHTGSSRGSCCRPELQTYCELTVSSRRPSPCVIMSFPEKCSFVPPNVYDGSLQRASSSAGEMSGKKRKCLQLIFFLGKGNKPITRFIFSMCFIRFKKKHKYEPATVKKMTYDKPLNNTT